MFRFEDLQKSKKHGKLKDIKIGEVSLVDMPANKLPFLIVKNEAGEQFSDLDELLSCEEFSDEQAEQLDEIMKWLDLDSDTSSAIGDLLLAVNSRPEIAKVCDGNFEEFTQSFISKAALQSDELEVINNALDVVSDLDDVSLQALTDLLRIRFSENVITKRWPSLFKHIEVEKDSEPIERRGLLWPSLSTR